MLACTIALVLWAGQLRRLAVMGPFYCFAFFTGWAYIAATLAATLSALGQPSCTLTLAAFSMSFVAGVAYWGVAYDPKAPHSQIDADNILRHGGSAALLALLHMGGHWAPAPHCVAHASQLVAGALGAFLLWAIVMHRWQGQWPYGVMATPRGFATLAVAAALLAALGIWLGHLLVQAGATASPL